MNEKLPKLKLSAKKIVIAITAILAVLLLVLLIWSLFSDSFNLFGNDLDYTEDESSAVIPEMQAQNTGGGQDIYYKKNTDDPLADLKELDSYSMTLRMISFYGENRSIDSVTVTKHGEKYKAVSDSRIMIYDGETLYIDYGTETLKIPADRSTHYEEIGVTSLEELRSMANDTEHYKTTFEVSSDSRIIEVIVHDLTLEGMRMEFEVSLESGLVTSERSYLNDTAYRIIMTESLDLTGAGISEDTFRIPE